MPSLSDIRANPIERPQRTYSLCLDGTLPAALGRLHEEEQQIMTAATSGPKKMSEGTDPRLLEIRDEAAKLLERLNDNVGVLTVCATPSNGEWQTFADANPARAEGEKGHERDQRYAAGLVNIDALVADLGRYAHAWDGEPLVAGDWERISASAAPADLRGIASEVVRLYEESLDFQRLRHALSDALAKSNSSEPHDPSDSLPAASKVGSRRPSTAATTNKAASARSPKPSSSKSPSSPSGTTPSAT